jgi:hypothetical protein
VVFEQKNEIIGREIDNINSIPSKIFYEICNELKYNKKSEFYKNIIVSVFCVFNISKQANNPPPIPYININRFKQLYYLEIIKKYGNSGEKKVEKNNKYLTCGYSLNFNEFKLLQFLLLIVLRILVSPTHSTPKVVFNAIRRVKPFERAFS